MVWTPRPKRRKPPERGTRDTMRDGNAFFGHWRISATKKVSKGQAHPTRKNTDVGGHVQGRQVATNIQAHQTHGDTGALQQHVTTRCFGRVAALS